ncbi:hypothetical protein [Saccharothrix lopnurensis]|uniref:Helix-turn-helix protein n=1 Tax=Saccharothrix lopnurensis TaxID=1670621 RepID=A0ABW1PGR6_9PSEU
MIEERRFRQALGAELQRRREDQALTRPGMTKWLSGQVHADLSHRTLESVERGDREISVYRLWIMCRALAIDPGDVLADVITTLGIAPPDAVPVDLRALRATRDRALAPLQAWAACAAPRARVLHLPPDALPPLAVVCGLSADALAHLLKQISPGE